MELGCFNIQLRFNMNLFVLVHFIAVYFYNTLGPTIVYIFVAQNTYDTTLLLTQFSHMCNLYNALINQAVCICSCVLR